MVGLALMAQSQPEKTASHSGCEPQSDSGSASHVRGSGTGRQPVKVRPPPNTGRPPRAGSTGGEGTAAGVPAWAHVGQLSTGVGQGTLAQSQAAPGGQL